MQAELEAPSRNPLCPRWCRREEPNPRRDVNFPYLLELELSASPTVGILVQARNKQAPNSGGIHSKGTVRGVFGMVSCRPSSSSSSTMREVRLLVIMVGWEKVGPLPSTSQVWCQGGGLNGMEGHCWATVQGLQVVSFAFPHQHQQVGAAEAWGLELDPVFCEPIMPGLKYRQKKNKVETEMIKSKCSEA